MGRRKPRASVGFALIAKDAEKTLGRCLDSIRPYVRQIVVGVDERTADATGEVAVKHGADLVFPLAVSGWHECPRHGRVLAQHFAEARNAAFGHLDPSLDWWAWIDADDVLRGGEFLKDIAEGVPEDVNCVWAPYHYATVKDGAATTTLFDRERLLRPRAGWVWTHRVHETVAPTKEPLAPVRTERLAWFHQEGVHKTEASTTRNHLLLEIDLEERPDDPRTVFYIANGYFAQQKWAEAADWYERLTALGGNNEYEIWQSYVYMATAYQQTGDLDSATRACFCAIDVVPDHPEPYFRLASVYLAAGQFEKVLKWDAHARTKRSPPPFVFANPLDYTLNSKTVMADALAQLGRIPEARRALEEAHRAVPDETVAKGIAKYRKIEEDARVAQAFVDLASTVDDDTALALYAALPLDVRAFGRTRDLAVPILMKKRDARCLCMTTPRIIFWAGQTLEDVGPPVLTEKGIGGSETALVEIARRFQADGWRVDVYVRCGRYEGEHDGVGYWEPQRLGSGEEADVLVSWRQPSAHSLPVRARRRVVWLHDHNHGPGVGESLARFDRVLGVSDYHAGVIAAAYELGNVSHVPNGIDLTRFDPTVKKVAGRCVYASSPDRGLVALLKMWPEIRGSETKPELHVAYGWENFDKWIDAGRADMAEFKAETMALLERTPGVVHRGRLPQDELARLYGESYALLYPGDFLETSCITAMEAMAGGCIPITSSCGATKETVGDGGLVVWGPGKTRSNPYSPAWRDFYVNCARSVLYEVNTRKFLELKARERAKAFTWDISYRDHWKPIVEGLLSGEKKEAVAA